METGTRNSTHDGERMKSTQSNAIAHMETTGIEVLSNVFYITNSLLDESLPSPTGQESHDAL